MVPVGIPTARPYPPPLIEQIEYEVEEDEPPTIQINVVPIVELQKPLIKPKTMQKPKPLSGGWQIIGASVVGGLASILFNPFNLKAVEALVLGTGVGATGGSVAYVLSIYRPVRVKTEDDDEVPVVYDSPTGPISYNTAPPQYLNHPQPQRPITNVNVPQTIRMEHSVSSSPELLAALGQLSRNLTSSPRDVVDYEDPTTLEIAGVDVPELIPEISGPPPAPLQTPTPTLPPPPARPIPRVQPAQPSTREGISIAHPPTAPPIQTKPVAQSSNTSGSRVEEEIDAEQLVNQLMIMGPSDNESDEMKADVWLG